MLDLARLSASDDAAEIAAVAARECRLTNAALVVGPVEVLAERGAAAVRAFAELACPVVLIGSRPWDPNWSRGVPVLIDAPMPSIEDRARVWTDELGVVGGDVDPAREMVQFRLSPEQTVRAAHAASRQAAAEGRPLTADDLKAGARSQNAAGLERLSRRVRPLVAWDDLVLPDEVAEQLHELASRARFRDVVLDAWGMGRTSIKGRGLTALFAGDSGTGKTMSAEVMAADLGLDLYVIDLSTVVDKYVGETEKNLDRIFTEADRVNGVLLFDEADAVFGKRSDVKDSHDRYANVEVAYLLQRMELFDGVAILTTNLRANLDEAFTRRLDAVVDFPVPDDDGRLASVAEAPAAGRAARRRPGPGLPVAPVQVLGRQHPQHRTRRRLPGSRGRQPIVHGATSSTAPPASTRSSAACASSPSSAPTTTSSRGRQRSVGARAPRLRSRSTGARRTAPGRRPSR